jgi:hypothetical protein
VAGLGKKIRPYLHARDVAQAVDCLASKHIALNSSPSTTTTPQKKCILFFASLFFVIHIKSVLFRCHLLPVCSNGNQFSR